MTTSIASAPRSTLSRTTLFRIAERLGLSSKARPGKPVPNGSDARALAHLSDHLLRDIGLVRDSGVRPTYRHL